MHANKSFFALHTRYSVLEHGKLDDIDKTLPVVLKYPRGGSTYTLKQPTRIYPGCLGLQPDLHPGPLLIATCETAIDRKRSRQDHETCVQTYWTLEGLDR